MIRICSRSLLLNASTVVCVYIKLSNRFRIDVNFIRERERKEKWKFPSLSSERRKHQTRSIESEAREINCAA